MMHAREGVGSVLHDSKQAGLCALGGQDCHKFMYSELVILKTVRVDTV